MKTSDIMQAIFIVCLAIFLFGLFGDFSVIQSCTVALCSLGLAALIVSWGALPAIPIVRRQALFLALADVLVFLLILLIAIFVLKGFIVINLNLDYAILGTLFLSTLLVRLLALRVMDK